jgi:hypothetical protein
MAASRVFEEGFCALTFVFETDFGGVGFEAVYVEGVVALGFHEHANVAGLLVLRRDRLIAIRTHLLSIKVIDHYRLAFLLFVHFTVYRLSGDFWHFLGWLENARLGKFRCGLTCKWSLLRLDWLDYWLLHWLMHRLLDRLHHWLHHWLHPWLVDRLVNRLLHRLHDWLLHRLTLFRNPCINISCE